MSKTYPPCLALMLSLIFSSFLYSQPNFSKQTVSLGGQNYPSETEVADIDNDGLLDILVYNQGGHFSQIAARQTIHISWHKNLGNGDYEKRVIAVEHVKDGHAADFDGDGDIDILYAAEYEGNGDPRDNVAEVGILLNDGTGRFTDQTIDLNRSNELGGALRVKDFNNDGLLDFTLGFEEEDYEIVQVGPNTYEAQTTGIQKWREYAFINRGNTDFRQKRIGYESVYRGGVFITENSADLNNDGYEDFAVMEWESNSDRSVVNVLLFNPDDTTFTQTASQEVSTTNAAGFRDVDDDGDLDIVGFYFGDLGGPIVMFNDGAGGFTTEFNVDNDVDSEVREIDFDNDGDLDQILTHYSWYENLGNGNYEVKVIDAVLKNATTTIEDVDQDGDYDIVVVILDNTSPDNKKVFLWENDGNGIFDKKLLDNNHYWMREVDVVDLDQDGDKDLVATTWVTGEILWFENDGEENFIEHIVVENWNGVIQVEVADFDQDGDLDIGAISSTRDRFSRFENDGNQNFHEVLNNDNVDGAFGLEAEDFNGDGWVDMVTSGTEITQFNIVAWFNDQSGNFATRTNLVRGSAPRALASHDLDNDGDADLLVGHLEYQAIMLYKNDGTGIFEITPVSRAIDPNYIALVDMDDDSRMDIIASEEKANGKLMWFLNDRDDTFLEHTISENGPWGPITAADYDNDGDVDVFAQKAGGNRDLIYFENDGDYNFTETVYDEHFWYARDLISEDLDDDGDIDLIGTGVGHGIVFWENEISITTPKITYACPNDQIQQTTGDPIAVTWNAPTATTNCPDRGLQITQISGQPNGATFAVGTHVITYEITDACGNVEICGFNIVIEKDFDLTCPTEYNGFTFLGEYEGHHYFLSEYAQDWKSAQKTACNLGGYLVSIETQPENRWVQSHINEIVFIGINDAESERDLRWDTGDFIGPTILNFIGGNTEENDYGYMRHWSGSWGFYNQWVHKKFIVEIDCNTYRSCKINADLSLVQCDDNATPDDPEDDMFGFQLLVEGGGDVNFWQTNLNGVQYRGDYDEPKFLEGIPLFAPGQTFTITIEDVSGGCATTVDIPIPEPCPGVVACPTELPDYQFLGAFEGHHYFLSENVSTWLDATAFVKGKPGYLVSINSEEENDFIQSKMSEIAFIGLFDFTEEGNLQWLSGEGYFYQNEGNCGICSNNTEDNDFGSFNFWDGTWGFDNQWVQRKHILEFECELLSDLTVTTRSAEPIVTEEMTLFPNPVKDRITVRLNSDKAKEETFRIFNLQNQLLLEQKVELMEGQNQLQFDLSKLSSGFYILKSEHGVAKKFVVESRD